MALRHRRSLDVAPELSYQELFDPAGPGVQVISASDFGLEPYDTEQFMRTLRGRSPFKALLDTPPEERRSDLTIPTRLAGSEAAGIFPPTTGLYSRAYSELARGPLATQYPAAGFHELDPTHAVLVYRHAHVDLYEEELQKEKAILQAAKQREEAERLLTVGHGEVETPTKPEEPSEEIAVPPPVMTRADRNNVGFQAIAPIVGITSIATMSQAVVTVTQARPGEVILIRSNLYGPDGELTHEGVASNFTRDKASDYIALVLQAHRSVPEA